MGQQLDNLGSRGDGIPGKKINACIEGRLYTHFIALKKKGLFCHTPHI
jgi:hypothetical protein